jgi:hypothetical protein
MKTATKLLKTRSLWLRAIAVGAVIAVGLAGVPAFAKEPMTISGVWYFEEDTNGVPEKTKYWYYFSPGGVDGTVVGIASLPEITGGQQIIAFTGKWDFEEKDGHQLFCVYGVKLFVSGRFVSSNTPMPSQGIYRFYTEGGKQKMEHQVRYSDTGELAKTKWILTKTGTKVSELPQIGPLAIEGFEGPKFWASEGIVVK